MTWGLLAKSFSRAAFLVVFLQSASWGGYFLEEPKKNQEPVRELPSWLFGGAFDIGFYLNELDIGLSLDGEYRISKHHALGLSAGTLFGGELYEVGLDWRIFFAGSMMEVGYDDFIHVGFSGVYFEKMGEPYFPPRISVGYGRDLMPLRKADFLCRMEIRFSYLLGETISENDEEKLINRDTHLVTYFTLTILAF